MNEVLNTIANRYSCRSFTNQAVENDKVEAIALAALQAPSAVNKQPWQIIVIKDKALIEEMDAYGMTQLDEASYQRIMGRGGKLFYNAPLMLVIAKNGNKDLDCGIVTQNVTLAATSLGLGNVVCALAGFAFNNDSYKKRIIPEGYEFAISVLIGYPTHPNGKAHEVDLNKITYIG
jgi:nitroreductase